MHWIKSFSQAYSKSFFCQLHLCKCQKKLNANLGVLCIFSDLPIRNNSFMQFGDALLLENISLLKYQCITADKAFFQHLFYFQMDNKCSTLFVETISKMYNVVYFRQVCQVCTNPFDKVYVQPMCCEPKSTSQPNYHIMTVGSQLDEYFHKDLNLLLNNKCTVNHFCRELL